MLVDLMKFAELVKAEKIDIEAEAANTRYQQLCVTLAPGESDLSLVDIDAITEEDLDFLEKHVEYLESINYTGGIYRALANAFQKAVPKRNPNESVLFL